MSVLSGRSADSCVVSVGLVELLRVVGVGDTMVELAKGGRLVSWYIDVVSFSS